MQTRVFSTMDDVDKPVLLYTPEMNPLIANSYHMRALCSSKRLGRTTVGRAMAGCKHTSHSEGVAHLLYATYKLAYDSEKGKPKCRSGSPFRSHVPSVVGAADGTGVR